MRLLIIGGGAAGLASLKAVLDTEEHESGRWTVTLLEEREDIGGIWLPAEPVDDPLKTPLYDSLTTNIPHPIMAYESLMFPPETPLFPHASLVLEYLQTYATLYRLRPHIRLRTRVTHTAWEDARRMWNVAFIHGGRPESVEADRLIIANGHYRTPYFPPLPGLQDWLDDGRVTHAAWYRRPHPEAVVAIVGGGPSGRDLANDYLQIAQTVVHSVRGQSPEDCGKLRRRAAVARFLHNQTLEFEDGTNFGPIDHVILATGYSLSFPFLETMVAGLPSISPFPKHLINSQHSLFPLARFLFPLQDDYPPSSAAFIGLPVKVVPFPIMEAQARAVIKVFRHPECLDVTSEKDTIRHRYFTFSRAGLDQRRIAHDWHIFVGEEQFDYRDELNTFSGGPFQKVDDWVKELYSARAVLRGRWREIEQRGEAPALLRGVGYGGVRDWIRLMYQILGKQC